MTPQTRIVTEDAIDGKGQGHRPNTTRVTPAQCTVGTVGAGSAMGRCFRSVGLAAVARLHRSYDTRWSSNFSPTVRYADARLTCVMSIVVVWCTVDVQVRVVLDHRRDVTVDGRRRQTPIQTTHHQATRRQRREVRQRIDDVTITQKHARSQAHTSTRTAHGGARHHACHPTRRTVAYSYTLAKPAPPFHLLAPSICAFVRGRDGVTVEAR
jgi:hypothetical protein